MAKKIPIRQCVACREHREKTTLARIVRTPHGDILYDVRGKAAGRGAYVCRQIACLEKAVKSRALERVLEASISPDIYESLRRQMKEEAEGGE